MSYHKQNCLILEKMFIWMVKMKEADFYYRKRVEIQEFKHAYCVDLCQNKKYSALDIYVKNSKIYTDSHSPSFFPRNGCQRCATITAMSKRSRDEILCWPIMSSLWTLGVFSTQSDSVSIMIRKCLSIR